MTGLLHPKAGPFRPPVYKDGFRDSIDAVDENGCVGVPDGPGVGVEFDWDYIVKQRSGGAVYV